MYLDGELRLYDNSRLLSTSEVREMKTQKVPAVFLCCVVLLCQTGHAQKRTPAHHSTADARLERLAGLAKVWGAVKYFHPFLAYRAIDWDKALIETIPKVNAAKTPHEYESALNQMLAVLNDKSTRAELAPEIEHVTVTTSPAGSAAKHVRTENQVLIIDATQIAKTIAKDNTALNGLVTSINQALPNAKGVIIDARGTEKTGDIESYFFDVFLRQTLPSVV